MFEKVGEMAEQVATQVSRREFLGRLAGTAMTAAAVLAGILAFSGGAAAKKPGPQYCDPAFSIPECAGALEGMMCGGGGYGGYCDGAPACGCNVGKPRGPRRGR
jgi:hypothetical protein